MSDMFPYADVPQFGRVTAQLQRTYYIEQIVPGNNFSANLLTIALAGCGKKQIPV